LSDVEVKRTETVTRHEAAARLAALSSALSEGGRVEIALGDSAIKLHVPDHVRYEVEVEVDGDEVELELEMKWSTNRGEAPPATAAPEPPKRRARSS
jgi:amphi-Trp domain-containing protein